MNRNRPYSRPWVSASTSVTRNASRQKGAAMVETLVALLALAPLGLGAVQMALIYNAKTTLNYATYEAARAGAVGHAQRGPMTAALARGMLPLYGGGSDSASLATSQAKAYLDLSTPAVPNMNLGSGTKVEILSPTKEAFTDWGKTVQGQEQIVNAHLRYRARTVGSDSGVTIQDANLLKIKVTYGYKLFVPVVNKLMGAALAVADPANASYYKADPPRLPLVAQATLRMQSNPYPDNNASSPGSAGGGTVPPGGGGTVPGGEPGGGEGGGGGGSGGSGGGPVACTDAGCNSTDPCADGSCEDGDPMACPGSSPAANSISVASLGVGNPINVATGNKYQREADLIPLPGILGLEYVRHYNSRSHERGSLGYGWTHSYDVVLTTLDGQTMTIRQADGRRIVFRKQAATDRYTPVQVGDGYLEVAGENSTWHWRNGRTMTFNAEKHLSQISAPTGESVVLTYDRNGRLLQVTDPQRRTLAFSYYDNGRIKTVLDQAGLSIRYTYDEAGNLASATSPDASVRTYHYEDPADSHNLTGITDGRGIRYATYAYDGQDRAVLSTHAHGVGQVTLKFAKDRTIVTNSKGKDSVYRTEKHNGLTLVSSIEGPGCSACGTGDLRYRYNNRLQLTQVTGKAGITTFYDYDTQDRLVRISRQAGSEKERTLARYSYQADAVQPSQIATPSIKSGVEHKFELRYNREGQFTLATEAGFRPDGSGKYFPIYRSTEFSYKDGNLVSVDGPLSGHDDTVRYEYDDVGRLTAIVRPGNLISRIGAYDAYGRPTHQIDPSGRVTEYRYNYQGLPTDVIQGTRKFRIDYDIDGRPLQVTRPDGSYVRAVYDDAGRLSVITDAQGNQIRWEQDSEDNIAQVALLDANDNVTNERGFEYDDENRLIRSLLPDSVTAQYFYGDDGHIQAVMDAAGRKTAYQYDVYGRVIRALKAAQTAEPVVTQLSYDTQGQVQKFTDANNNATSQEIDDFGLRTVLVNPDRGITLYRYDSAGRLIAMVNERGVISNYYYDIANRLTGVGVGKHGPSLTYEYQGDLLTGIIDPNQTTRFRYDANKQLVEESKTIAGHTFITHYRYNDTTGQLIEKVLPDGQTLHYQYDPKTGQPRALTRKDLLGQTTIAGEFSYRPFGPVDGFVHGNGLATYFDYDNSGKLTRLATTNVQRMDYDYDNAGNIVGIRRNDISETYEHDSLGRLIRVKMPDTNFTWTYDKVGNRLTQAVNNQTERYDYVFGSNRLSAVHASVLKQVRYDNTGNPIEIGNKRYEYNGAGRSKALYVDGSLVATYDYNGQGQRIAKTRFSNGQRQGVTYYLYENNKVVAEADDSGHITAQYVYLGDRPLAMLVGKNIYAIHTDHIGTPWVITDKRQQVVWAARYTPFGAATVVTAGIVFNLRLPGQYYDIEAGTHYNYYRNYDPQTGRYLTSDPMGVAAGANTYLYAKADPLQGKDVLGLYNEDIHYYMTYFLARMAGIQTDEALTVALAVQYVDNNFVTSPFTGIPFGSLPAFHFTLNYDNGNLGDLPIPPGMSAADYARWRVENPLARSDQLQRLRNAAMQDINLRTYDANGNVVPLLDSSGKPVPLSRCAKAQLYGEFVHAFEDTFAHREADNTPFPVTSWVGGIGHALAGHAPDDTFNGIAGITETWDTSGYPTTVLESVSYDVWGNREAHTLEMEKELFSMLQSDFGSNGASASGPRVTTADDGFGDIISWSDLGGDGTSWQLTGAKDANGFPLDSTGRGRNTWGQIVDSTGNPDTSILGNLPMDLALIQWQRTCDISPGGCTSGSVLQNFNRARTEAEKIAILNQYMASRGFETIPAFNNTQAAQNRVAYLSKLVVQDDFNGVLLPQSNNAVCISGAYSRICP